MQDKALIGKVIEINSNKFKILSKIAEGLFPMLTYRCLWLRIQGLETERSINICIKSHEYGNNK